MKKKILFVLYMLLIWAVITLGLRFAFPVQPMQGQGDCGAGYVTKIENAPFEYDGDQIITKVFIKSSTNCFALTVANPSDGCYAATGLGTTHVRVSRIGEPSPDCQEISHVEYYTGIVVTNTPTSTGTATCTTRPTDTPTATFTPTETRKFTDTPTSTSTSTPDNTPTATPAITGTPGETETVTSTAPPKDTGTPESTPTATEDRPPKSKTSTPVLVLPATGEFRTVEDSIVIPLAFIALLVLILVVVGFRNRLRR